MKIGDALSWEEIANEYDKITSGRRARTLAMDYVFQFLKKRKDKFFFDETETTLHKIKEVLE